MPRKRRPKQTVADVVGAMEALAPRDWAASWDRVGLHIGAMDQRVSKVLVALSLTRAALDRAKAESADMLVLHHPPIWDPLKRLNRADPYTRLLLDAAQAGLACFAAHTNLDVAPGGVNHALAEALGLVKTAPLFPVEEAGQVKLVTFVPATHVCAVREAVCAAGAGVIGDYTHCTFSSGGEGTFLPGAETNPFSGERNKVNVEPERKFEVMLPKAKTGAVLKALFAFHPYEEVAYDLYPLLNQDASIGLGRRGELPQPAPLADFAKHVAARLGTKTLRFVGDGEKEVSRVAVLGGSGGGQAARLPLDIHAYVTGDAGYHDALKALERGVSIVDAGHGPTELPVLPKVADHLRGRLEIEVNHWAEPEIFQGAPS